MAPKLTKIEEERAAEKLNYGQNIPKKNSKWYSVIFFGNFHQRRAKSKSFGKINLTAEKMK